MKKTFYVLFIFFSVILFGQEELYICNTKSEGKFYISLKKDIINQSFTAYTNPRLIPNNLPFLKKVLFNTTKKGKLKGAIFKINDGILRGDSLINKKIKVKIMNNETFEGVFSYGGFKFEFTAKKVSSNYNSLKNYDQLYSNIKEILKKNIYNPEILKEKEWKQFLKGINFQKDKTKDDFDFFYSFLFQSKKLKTSHVYLLPKKESKFSSQFKFYEKENASILKFNGFSSNDVDSINHSLSNIKTQNLIIDLRDCGGGDFSSIILASHFIKEEKLVGYFLGNKYYNKTQKLPTKEELNQLKPFEGKTVTDLYNAIENEGIVKAVAKPILPFYGGKIWVLTNKNTASACEPLVDFLKVNNLATIIGEKTAGKMLSAKSFSIDENYELYLPIANYYTAQNFWIEQNGVEPNIAVKSENALDKVSELISK